MSKRPTKIPGGGYSYRGHTIKRERRSYYGHKRGKARKNAMGMIHTTVFTVEGEPLPFARLLDAVAAIDRKETATS